VLAFVHACCDWPQGTEASTPGVAVPLPLLGAGVTDTFVALKLLVLVTLVPRTNTARQKSCMTTIHAIVLPQLPPRLLHLLDAPALLPSPLRLWPLLPCAIAPALACAEEGEGVERVCRIAQGQSISDRVSHKVRWCRRSGK